MQRVDFYLLQDAEISRLECCCRLVDKQHHRHPIDCIIAPTEKLARLDKQLWTFEPISFIPHRRGKQNGYNSLISLLTPDEYDHPHSKTIWLHDSETVPQNLLATPHIIEIITHAPDVLSNSRKRYRHYKNAGFNIEIHTLNN